MAKTLRDANLIPEADAARIVGPTHDHQEDTEELPMYNITPPTPAPRARTVNSVPLAPRPPLPPSSRGRSLPRPGMTTVSSHTVLALVPAQLPPTDVTLVSTASSSSNDRLDFHRVDDSMDTMNEMEDGEVEDEDC